MSAVTDQVKRNLLARVPLFEGLGKAELDALVAAARTRVVQRQEQLFHKGDEGRHVYVVVRGNLKALTTSFQGDDVVFNIQGPGEMLGEIALLVGQRRTATITAIEKSELLMIERRDFIDCLRRNPEVSLKLLQVLAERVKGLSERLEDTMFLNLPVRFAKKLLDYAASDGEKSGDGIRIGLKLTQEEWGALLGVTRESVNKQLRAWSNEGLISREETGHIVLMHPERLESIARLSLDPPPRS